MEVDRPGVSEETCVKKQKMDVGAGARLDFDLSHPAVVPIMVSPVTAFSQLNFNQLSPLCESPSPPADEQRATNSLKAESSPSVAGSTSTSSTTSSVVIRLGSKHSLKRPLSGPPCDTQRPQSFDCGSAKRALARPRSITLPSTIQPAQELCIPTHADVVRSPGLTRNCEESTVAADSGDRVKNIPATSESDSLSETSVDQCPKNPAE